jgi:uncharacterized protein
LEHSAEERGLTMKVGIAVLVLAVSALVWSTGHAGGLSKTEIAGEGFIADFYCSEGSQNKVVILLLGGSDGGKPDRLVTPLLSLSYPVMALAYFKTGELPEYLDTIPLEYFDKPIAWLQNNENTKKAKIVVVGASKGAELALLLASRKPQIAGVVGTAPSSVVWQGIPKTFWPPRSSWSFGGQPMPFVPYDYSKAFSPNDIFDLYKRSLSQREAVQKASIEAEKINGPILLLSGAQDSLWPSTEMGDMICQRLKEKEFKYKCEHVKYTDAGHTLNEYYMLGGSYDGNKRARLESAKRIAEFLKAIEAE